MIFVLGEEILLSSYILIGIKPKKNQKHWFFYFTDLKDT